MGLFIIWENMMGKFTSERFTWVENGNSVHGRVTSSGPNQFTIQLENGTPAFSLPREELRLVQGQGITFTREAPPARPSAAAA